MIQKLINAEIKTGLKSNIIIWNLDIYYLKSYYLFHNYFLKIQNQNFKNFSYFKKSKFKDSKPALLCNNMAELAKKRTKKIKKRNFKARSKNILERGKNKLQPLAWILLKLVWKRNISISHIIIMIKRVIIWNPAQNFQKTNINLNNFYANNW